MEHPFAHDLRWPESSAPDFDHFQVRRGIGWIGNPVLHSGYGSRCRVLANLGTETYAIRVYNRAGRWSPTIHRVDVTATAPTGWTASAGDLPRDELAATWPGTMVDVEVAPLPDIVDGSLHIAGDAFVGIYTTDALDAGSIDDWVWCVSFDFFQWWNGIPPEGLDSPLGDDWTGEGLSPSPLVLGAELEPTDWPWPIEQYPHPLRAPDSVLGRHTLGVIEARFSDDSITWSDWGEWWTSATRRGRYIQVRATMRRRDPAVHQLHLLRLRIDAAAPPTTGGGGAPTTAEYLVGALDGTLSAERLVTDTATVTWDLATGGQAKANVPDASAGIKGVVQLAGDLAGTAASPALASIVGAAGPIGAATTVPVVTIDAKGRVTALSSTTITGTVPAAHATSHQHSGSDEVATATPGANAIPKANGSGKLPAGWGGSASTLATLNASTRVVEPVLKLYDGVSTDLTITGIADGGLLVRSGTSITSLDALTTYILNQNDQVTDAHLRNSVGVSVIGRAANSTGDPADIAAAADDTVLGRRSSALTWAKISTAEINTNAVTDTIIRQGGACSVIGRSANSTGNVADISASTNDTVFCRSSNSLQFSQVTTAMLKDANVTDIKLRDSAACSVIGRSANSAGTPTDIALSTNEQVYGRRADAIGAIDLTDSSIILASHVFGF